MAIRSITLCVLLVLAACTSTTSIISKVLPSNIYQLPYRTPENAPKEYKMGFEHGCKSGFAAYGNDYFKSLYKFTQDVKMIRNPLYYKAWSDSFHYCRAYVNRLLAGYSFRKVPEGEVDAIIDNRTITARPVYDQRNSSIIQQESVRLGLFEGLELPGWNDSGWGSDVNCQSDWLGSNDTRNWLGQPTGENDDCNYLGNE